MEKTNKSSKSHSYGNFGLGVEFVPGDRSGIYTCVIPNKQQQGRKNTVMLNMLIGALALGLDLNVAVCALRWLLAALPVTE
eukprot:COSAG05_NODE_887_length_6737_cov_25.085719_4_plen_81_part_00